MNYDETKRTALELYIEDEVNAEQTERSKNALPEFRRLADNIASLEKFTRIVFIVWVGDEEYENWVDPRPAGEITDEGYENWVDLRSDGEITDVETAVQETSDNAGEAGPLVCTHGMNFFFFTLMRNFRIRKGS